MSKETTRTIAHTAKVKMMIMRIDWCIHALMADRPDRTTIKLVDDNWIVNDTPEGLI